MSQVVITINEREYPIACENGQEVRIMQLAQILEQKAQLLKSFNGKISENMMLAMIGILTADDLMEARKQLTSSATKPENQPAISAEDEQKVAVRIQNLEEKIKNIAKIIESV